MPFGSSYQYLLLLISGFVLLLQTAVKSHYHQPDSFYDARSSFHAPPSSLSLENPEGFSGIITPCILKAGNCRLLAKPAAIHKFMTVSLRHESSTSRAPPLKSECSS